VALASHVITPAQRELFARAQQAYRENDMDALLELLQSTSTPLIEALLADLEKASPGAPSSPSAQ